MRLLKISRLYLLSFFIFIIYTSCGIPTVGFLHPPTRIPNSGNNRSIGFTHNATNANIPGTDFRGYSIYYKLYSNAGDNKDDCMNDKNIITNVPISTGPQRLITQQFQQIVVDDIDQTPQILIPSDHEMNTQTITIGIADDKQCRMRLLLSEPHCRQLK